VTEDPGNYKNESYKLDAWERHEKVAMHFNDLILKVRIQALGALAALVTLGGLLLKTLPPSGHIPWGVVAAVLATFLAFWIAIWLLDFRYYNRLLMGAVDALLKLEDQINSGDDLTIEMSHKIEDSARGIAPTHRKEGTLSGPLWFYSIVTAVLVIGLVFSLYNFLCSYVSFPSS
jgi:hypothetical protein